ncbi:alcohol dehydrogenase catalytic domain-containing protein [Rossellomorea marisflavi]|uniref:alcohol dehydrogenase catalytic domain-containing protein n=1 Tax=Rossellomorea marisflavi TaxID=189381 RepID=UPI0009A8F864|nr:alcohol dehydrogenase catalytic domain-containing protein [Rossellomorea marisflavi]
MNTRLVLNAPRKLEWISEEDSGLSEDEIRVETHACGISIGAEMPQYLGIDPTDVEPVYPRKVGYESAGRVIEIGRSVTDFKVGNRVISFYGQQTFGVTPSKKAVRIPADVEWKYALLNTLSCDAAKGVQKLNLSKEDRVLVTGAGTMGVLAVHFLKHHLGVRYVDVVEPDEARHSLPLRLGADRIYRSEAEIEDPYDAGLECSAHSAAFLTLMNAMKPDGTICVLSDGNRDEFTLPSSFFEKELKIVASSDGYDYRKHGEWFFSTYEETPYLTDLFEREIIRHQVIACFEEMESIRPLKVFVDYKKERGVNDERSD